MLWLYVLNVFCVCVCEIKTKVKNKMIMTRQSQRQSQSQSQSEYQTKRKIEWTKHLHNNNLWWRRIRICIGESLKLMLVYRSQDFVVNRRQSDTLTRKRFIKILCVEWMFLRKKKNNSMKFVLKLNSGG